MGNVEAHSDWRPLPGDRYVKPGTRAMTFEAFVRKVARNHADPILQREADLKAEVESLRQQLDVAVEALQAAGPAEDYYGRPVVSGGWVTVYFRPDDWATLDRFRSPS